MPAAAIGAGISAAGSIGGAVAGGKSAKAVAKIQQQTAQEQMAQTKQFYDDAVARDTPDINYGNSAMSLYNGAIGNGGDADASAKALAAFQNSTGYQTTLNDDLNAVNASAYANGLGRSGAAMKALQDRGAYDAQQSFQSWLGNLNNSVQTGSNAKAALSGSATTALNSNNAALASSGAASSNAALASGASTSSLLQNLGNIAANAYQSSYGNGTTTNAYGVKGSDGIY